MHTTTWNHACRTAALLLGTASTLVAQPSPSSWPGIALPGGDRLEFRLHIPVQPAETLDRPCPVAFVFVDGAQGRGEVWDTLTQYFWMQTPEERVGVILPVAPKAGRFHEGGLASLEILLRSLRGKVRFKGNGLHAIGIGEGAASAIAAVRRWPHEFSSLTLAVSAEVPAPEAESAMLPGDARFAHLRFVVLAPGVDGAAPPGWAERVGAWKERGWRAEWRDVAAPDPDAVWGALRDVTAEAALSPAEVALRECLDRWHSAAARADAATYFSLWDADGVFLPPGANAEEPAQGPAQGIERWSLATLRERSATAFAQGPGQAPGWVLVPAQRWVRLADDGRSAWVEETLGSLEGACRGVGLLEKRDEGWRVVRYAMGALADGTLRGAPWGPGEVR